ncbi:MAG: hypothetical protein F2832_09460 [Actinobacteria bacterium]|nr:hypothetical protein [Actinomycetota bacterium]
MPELTQIRDLAATRPRGPVLSVLLRTDLRDPRNVNGANAWRIELRNGLREIRAHLPEDRDERAAFERAAQEMETWAAWAGGLSPHVRGRGLARFIAPQNGLDRAYTLQLPLEETVVVWNRRPYVLPLLAIADRGRPAGIVAIDQERVRLVSWADGSAVEPENATFELWRGRWTDYAAYADGNSQRAQQTGRHPEAFEDRERVHREVSLAEAAVAVGERARELEWARLLLVGDAALVARFEQALPVAAARLVAGRMPARLAELPMAEIAARAEPLLDELWRAEARDLTKRAHALACADEGAVVGIQATARALTESRVERLLVDPACIVPAELAHDGPVVDMLDGAPPTFAAERAAELALATGAAVTTLSRADGGEEGLSVTGGMAALLRH